MTPEITTQTHCSRRGFSTALVVIIVIVVLLGLWILGGYNGLVGKRADVDNSWANVETQYQRRADLIPNLVNTVKGASNFEQETLTAVTEARAGLSKPAATREQQIAAAEQFDSAFSRLLVTVEAYPQLQATQAYKDLMVQLEGTENRVNTARIDYNTSVRDYNVAVRSFPTVVIAGMLGFSAEKPFDAAPGSENAPSVNFDN